MNEVSMIGTWKIRRRNLKEGQKNGMENNKKAECMKKEMQNSVCNNQEVEGRE